MNNPTAHLPPRIAAIQTRPLPSWLAALDKTSIEFRKRGPDLLGDYGRLPLREILDQSCFYPGSGTDGHPVKQFGRCCLSFVYADFGISKPKLLEKIKAGCRGYRLVGNRNVTEELEAGEWWVADGERPYTEKGRIRLAPDPYAYWAIFERETGAGYGEGHGPQRFSFLFLCQDAIAAFQRLYVGYGVAPKFLAIIQPGGGIVASWTRLDDPHGALAQNVLRNPACMPEYLVYGIPSMQRRQSTCWPQYSDCLGYLYVGERSWIGVWQRGPARDSI